MVCGNCEFWGGTRRRAKPSKDGLPQTEHSGFGKCQCQQSRYLDGQRKSSGSCKHFQQWAVTCQSKK